MATLQAYVSDRELRQRSWQNRLTSPMWDSEPNAGHAALVALERSGRLDTLVTQNIDGLHQKAGTDPGRMVEIHGTALDVMCLRCGDRQPQSQYTSGCAVAKQTPSAHGRTRREGVRRHLEIGDDQLRPELGRRGPAPCRGGGRGL